jgi:hypothetical protein
VRYLTGNRVESKMFWPLLAYEGESVPGGITVHKATVGHLVTRITITDKTPYLYDELK